MPGTTPNVHLPYPEDTDLLIQGDDAIQALAEAVDTHLYRSYAHLTSDATQNALPDGIPNTVGNYDDSSATVEFAVDPGNGTITYGGPTRWFLITYGANLAANGGLPNGLLELVLAGTVPGRHTFNGVSIIGLGGSITGPLAPGQVLSLRATTYGGGSGGAYDSAHLRITSI